MNEREKIAETIVQIRGYTVLQAAQIADTLIAAGIGDVEEAKRKAFVYSKELTHLDGILKGAERRAEVAEKEFKKTEHRAEVAEKMFNILYEETSEYMKVLSKEWYKYQAEKELAEGKKE